MKIGVLSLSSFAFTFLFTPLFIKALLALNLIDRPNWRKVHSKPIPTLGGLIIFLGFLLGVFLIRPESSYNIYIILGAIVILLLGILDDLFNLSAPIKFTIQIVLAFLLVNVVGLQIEFINLPFGGQIYFGIFSTIITVLWIVGITNAINLIDGLDGLAVGVTMIALISIFIMAMVMDNNYVAIMTLILFLTLAGFLPYNFYPAKIFMGDTGSLFIGYLISVLSILGFKNVTFTSFLFPIFVLGVPILDTMFAIIRRILKKQSIVQADRFHIHHRLVTLGLSHRQTVLLIYGFSIILNITALIFPFISIWQFTFILIILLFPLLYLIEILELISKTYKPFTSIINMVRQRR